MLAGRLKLFNAGSVIHGSAQLEMEAFIHRQLMAAIFWHRFLLAAASDSARECIPRVCLHICF